MMASYRQFFKWNFAPLTGHDVAFAWQERLFERFCAGDIPDSVSVPTGCGKTSVMPIWLLALAYTSQSENRRLPRRLIWVVNRRVVVDQATNEAAAMAVRLGETGPAELAEVRGALRRLYGASNGRPLGVSTLRGQFADNAEWRSEPARPAVITGTVDMIGSRLLFSGYGCGFKSRPLHAGLLGQDALLVHDEAHLEPAFQSLLEAIEREQRQGGDFRPVRTMQLSATARSGGGEFVLSKEEMAEGEIGIRVNARKGFAFHSAAGQKELAAVVGARALEFRGTGAAVLVFLRRLADVETVFRNLQKAGCAAQRFTGTMRGHERDDLLRNDAILARLLPESDSPRLEGTVYLVSTSAGEVGVNLSADHAVCDVTPFDSMAQRLGRVNRFGKGDARVDVVYYPPPDKATALDGACGRALAVLRELPVREDGRLDGSPAALGRLDAQKREAAFTPAPAIVPTSDILFDRWALTSIRGALPGRPPVADWLHGVEESEAPQTYVAWREEVDVLETEALRAEYAPVDLLDDFPLKPHELLRDSSVRVVEQLERIAERVPAASFWIVDTDDEVGVTTFGEFARGDRKKLAQTIGDCTLVLPPAAGGLDKGFLAGVVPFSGGLEYDVSGRWTDEHGISRRVRIWDDEDVPDGMRLVRTLDLYFGREGEDEGDGGHRYWYWYVRSRTADDDGSQSAKGPQELSWHLGKAEEFAAALATSLGLAETEAEALRMAAAWHDRGKDRDVWQRSIGNPDYPRVVLAKSSSKAPTLQWSRYRHEFGSLIEMGENASDLARHMVSAHHGRARPHFSEDEAFDPRFSDAIVGVESAEVPGRFVRLQKQYGRWGLAYLESLLRVVDARASQEEPVLEAKA